MNTAKKWLPLAALLAIIAPACSGEDTSIGSPTDPPTTEAASPPETDAPIATEAPTTTVAETTTTEAELVLSYTLDLTGLTYENGEATGPLPTEGVPLEARNPINADAMTLQEVDDLDDDTQVCFRDEAMGELTVTVHSAVLKSYFDSTMTEPYAFLAVHATDPDNGTQFWNAAERGIITYPDGEWSPTAYVTEGVC